MTDLPVIESGALSGLSHIAHAFFTRQGGVSKDLYATLNTGAGSGDERANVIENRARCAGHLRLDRDRLVSVHQIHSATVHVVTEPWAIGQGPQGDAMVTNEPGLALGVLAADCTPVLFADRANAVIGAAHAGWKGALGGVTDAVIAEMERLGASRDRIAAAIGPVIARVSYEVDDGFARRFEEADPENERFFTPGREGHQQFDLEAYVAARLARAGLARVEVLGLDTYADPERFFSFRRATHRNEPGYGRQISLIGLPG